MNISFRVQAEIYPAELIETCPFETMMQIYSRG